MESKSFSTILQVKEDEQDEERSLDEQEEEEEEENWEKALSVERFGDIISESSFSSGDRTGRNYTEKDFECKQRCYVTCNIVIESDKDKGTKLLSEHYLLKSSHLRFAIA